MFYEDIASLIIVIFILSWISYSIAVVIYLNQLTNILEPLIFEGFQRLYDEAFEFKEETKDPRLDDYSVLQIFQDMPKLKTLIFLLNIR